MESKVYAIVDIGGCQIRVIPDETLRVPRMRAAVGDKIKVENVLLLADGSRVEVGRPYLEGKSLEAEVLRHGRERKVIVFKKKRRKKYRRKKGHRQPFTEIVVRALPPFGVG